MRLLLEKGANIEATKSTTGSTALILASWRGYVGVVSPLLKEGANTKTTRTDNGGAALHDEA